MSGNNGSIAKMLLLRPEVYAKLIKPYEFEQNMSDLDRNMKTILSDSKLNEIDKWYRYRQQLISHGNKWRNQQKHTNTKIVPSTLPSQVKPIVRDNSTQMFQKVGKNMETQTNHLVNKDDYITSLNIINNARLDDEISNIDINQLTSPTNRLSLGNDEFSTHGAIGATSVASTLKKKRSTALHTSKPITINKRTLSYEDKNDAGVADNSRAIAKLSRAHLKRSATQPDQLEIDFPMRKKLNAVRHPRVQTGTSLRYIQWTKI